MGSKCVQWGRFYGGALMSSKCYLSSTVTTAQKKWGSTCGRKSSSSQDLDAIVLSTPKESKTEVSANQCTDSCKLEGDTLCHGDAYKVIDTDPTIQECCDACAADSRCVQWGRFYGGVLMSSKCYLSSTVTTAQKKWGSTCGRKSSSSQDLDAIVLGTPKESKTEVSANQC